MAGPFDAIKRAKERLMAETPAPPDNDDEDDDMPMRIPVKKQNDALYDAAILLGVVCVTLLINGAFALGSSWWNEHQAEEYFAKHHDPETGRRVHETSKAYQIGLFMAAHALAKPNTVASAKPVVPSDDTN